MDYTILHTEFLSNLYFPRKTEGSLNLLYRIYIVYYSGVLSSLRFPWKTKLLWNFSLYLICVIHSGVLSKSRLSWKQSCPENLRCMEYIFAFRIFEQFALALKNRVAQIFFTVLNRYFLLFRSF